MHEPPSPSAGASRLKWLYYAVLTLFALAYSQPVFVNIHNRGIGDWDQHFFYHEAPAKTVVEYGEIPLWNPYYCGGNALLAYPQTRIITPFFGLHLLFDTPVALKLELFLHLAIGLCGAWLLCRYLGAKPVISLAAAVLILGNGVYAHRMIGGHTWYLSQAYFPWVIYFLLRCLRDKKPIWPAAALIALMLFEGGIYTVPHIFMYSAILTVVYAGLSRSWIPLWRMVQLVGVTTGLAAIKLLPFLDFFRLFPRHIHSSDSMSPLFFWRVLTEPNLHDHREFLVGRTWGFNEYGAYIGYIPAVLGIIFLIYCLACRWRTHRLLVATLAPGIVFAVLALGSFAEYSPWAILHELPLFRSMRVPSRFLPGFLLALGVAFAWGLTMLQVSWKKRWQAHPPKLFTRLPRLTFWLPAAAAFAITALVMVDVGYQNSKLLKRVFRYEPITEQAQQPFHQISGRETNMYAYVKANIGTVKAYEMMNFGPYAIPDDSSDYRGEAYLMEGGSAEIRDWSPNAMAIHYASSQDNLLVINQNYSTDWRSPSGHAVLNYQGLIAIPVPADADGVVRIAYQPLSFTIGACLSLITIILLAYSGYRKRRNQPKAEPSAPPNLTLRRP